MRILIKPKFDIKHNFKTVDTLPSMEEAVSDPYLDGYSELAARLQPVKHCRDLSIQP